MQGAAPSTLMEAGEVAAYLSERGLLTTAAPGRVEPLGGGVSNAVFGVEAGASRLVLKQALPRLRVADVWEADPARVTREGLALRTLHALTPASVPDCLDIDGERFTLVVPYAPVGWVDWKSRLLAGDADPAIARRLGVLLATWHTATRSGVPEPLHDGTAFEQLRVDPFYRTVMERRPEVGDAVAAHLRTLLERRECLVHGDFSPKNVLCGEDGLWVIDMEVAHVGDPAFDLASMLSHLALKAVRRPDAVNAYGACAVAFAAGYHKVAGDPPWPHVLGHVGCLLLARVAGKSPVDYLDERQQAVAWAIGEELVTAAPTGVPPLWARVEEVVGR